MATTHSSRTSRVGSSPLVPGDPRQLGDYWLAGRLGAGGQGVVYEAYDPDGNRVAVKTLHGDFVGDGSLDRFAKEVEAARRVSSFCTARIIAVDLEHTRPYIVSEYVPGPDLQRAVATGGTFGPDELHWLGVGVATALTAIHQAGVIHRDLKPANVLLGPGGPRVIDFGIARTDEMSRSATGQIKGTPRYMAPETFQGERAGPEADIWAWGAVLLFAATGRAPFAGDQFAVIMRNVLHHEPDLTALPESLRATVAAARRARPGRRQGPAVECRLRTAHRSRVRRRRGRRPEQRRPRSVLQPRRRRPGGAHQRDDTALGRAQPPADPPTRQLQGGVRHQPRRPPLRRVRGVGDRGVGHPAAAAAPALTPLAGPEGETEGRAGRSQVQPGRPAVRAHRGEHPQGAGSDVRTNLRGPEEGVRSPRLQFRRQVHHGRDHHMGTRQRSRVAHQGRPPEPRLRRRSRVRPRRPYAALRRKQRRGADHGHQPLHQAARTVRRGGHERQGGPHGVRQGGRHARDRIRCFDPDVGRAQ
ncbi:serine/threonine protein kinase [Actinomadura alba]|uniref:Serine/threonine protein kinase n=1 Tax=Actinomadura alba TaxID=406431 RepID=A0ABR7LN95_9ACTN|nr:serine/threonine protein kinase [Actinomadura alba]